VPVFGHGGGRDQENQRQEQESSHGPTTLIEIRAAAGELGGVAGCRQ
jgi:hypothetical protein